MAFIYHRVPEHISGNILYPVNELGLVLPSIYSEHQEKYKERPHVLEDSIPRLGCFWGDVLHFTAIRPAKLAEAFLSIGKKMQLHYYEIEASKLEPEKSVVYLNRPKAPGERTSLSDFVRYDPKNLDEYTHIPEGTLQYYRQNVSSGDDFMLYYNIPVILYKGNLDISGVPIINA